MRVQTVTVMLMTSLPWWLYDGDRFQMLVAESLCCRLFSLCWWFSQCIKPVTEMLNRSLTSQTCHHHIWSPASVTNIDVTVHMIWFIWYHEELRRVVYQNLFKWDELSICAFNMSLLNHVRWEFPSFQLGFMPVVILLKVNLPFIFNNRDFC